MTRTQDDDSWRGQYVGLMVAASGLLHFVRPELFEPINRQPGFIERTRRHVYINGAIETGMGIGIGIASGKARTLTRIVSVCYPAYLGLNAVRARYSS
jgi:uncharacterized membrane protein